MGHIKSLIYETKLHIAAGLTSCISDDALQTRNDSTDGTILNIATTSLFKKARTSLR
jgi:hypothetical protein